MKELADKYPETAVHAYHYASHVDTHSVTEILVFTLLEGENVAQRLSKESGPLELRRVLEMSVGVME